MTKERQPRLGIAVGCILALACVSADSANAQVVQATSENQSEILGVLAQLDAGESSRFSSRRVLVQVPQQGTTPFQSAALKIGVDRVDISTKPIGTGVLPENTAAKRAAPSTSLLDGQLRGIVSQQVNWRPANVCHLPLYFEDAMLERHGHVRWGCAQPIVSGAKFLTTIPLLPYITTLQPPCEPRYTLGHFRPGSCAPALKDHLPWDRRAATVEVVSLGAFFLAAPL